MAQKRSNGVRTTFSLAPSGGASDIRKKYLPLAEQMTDAKATESAPPPDNLGVSYC